MKIMRSLNTFLLMAAVNLGIILTLSFVINLLGFDRYLTANGISYQGLALFCLIFGMGGAFISLLLSKTIVKWTMKIQVIDATTRDAQARDLFEMVRRLSQKADLPEMPEVGIYASPELNAFATGPSKSSSLVAVSTGLLAAMSPQEIEGVIGHEISHIANGDMVRMTLLQGVMNALIMFVARIIAAVVTSNLEERNRFMARWIITMVAEMALGVLGMMVIAAYSRRREFRADAGGASLAGRDNMIQALKALKERSRFEDTRQPQLAAFKISSGPKSGFVRLIMTHPPIEERIHALTHT